MTQHENEIIRRFALDGSNKEAALQAYRRHLVLHQVCRGTPELDFMSEVDNVCPDLALRAEYRKRLIAH